MIDPFAKVDIIYETTSQNLQTLGQAESTSTSSELTCVTRRSAESEVGDDKYIDVSCNSGEVLTGCSSYLKVGDCLRMALICLYHDFKHLCFLLLVRLHLFLFSSASSSPPHPPPSRLLLLVIPSSPFSYRT